MKRKVVGCLVVCLMLGAVLFFAVRADERGVGAVTLRGARETDGQRNETLNLLLLGCDDAASLCDSILLVALNRSNGALRVLQLPRDTYAAYTERDYKKLNGIANSLGAQGAKRWLSEALGVPIDYVAVYNLDCVRRAVDAVGGVEIDVPCPMRYSDPVQGLEIDLPAGPQRLNGEQAEGFIRFRAGYANADLGRLDAQKLFLQAFLSAAHALPVARLLRIALSILPSVQTDLPIGQAVSALLAAESEKPSLSVTTAPGEAVMGESGAWYYVLNRADMISALGEWMDGTEVRFDPLCVFDRPESAWFHKIYTANGSTP